MERSLTLISAVGVLALALSACGGGAASAPEPQAPEGPAPAEAPSPREPDPAPSAAAAPAAEPPPVAAASPAEGGSRTDAIAEVIKANRKQARDCYEQALKQESGLKGNLVIAFTLAPSGKVKLAELNTERSTLLHAGVATCVIDVIRGLPFPASPKGLETSVNYPFNFNP